MSSQHSSNLSLESNDVENNLIMTCHYDAEFVYRMVTISSRGQTNLLNPLFEGQNPVHNFRKTYKF